MKQCFAVKESHPVLPDRVVHIAESAIQAQTVCEVKNGEAIRLIEKPRFYVGITRLN